MTVERLPSASLYAPKIGFSSAVRVGDCIYLSGVTAVAPDGTVVGGDDPYLQARECVAKLVSAAQGLGARIADIVQTRIYLVDGRDFEAVGRAHGEAFADCRPASTMVVVKALLDDRMLVEIEAIAEVATTR